MNTLQGALDRRAKADQKVIDALNHLPRTLALSTILSWISIEDLEKAMPTICGSDEPVKDPVEAFAHRLRIACIQRRIAPVIIHARDGRPVPKGKRHRSNEVIDRLLKEAMKEALT